MNAAASPTYTADLSDAFVAGLAKAYGAQAVNLLQVWQSESAIKAMAHNPNGHASGLNQLMPAIAKGLGWDPADCAGAPPATPLARYRALTAEAQLAWVERYYAPHAAICTSPELWYLATFLPAYLLRPAATLTDDFVLAAKAGPLGWAYEANMTFDPTGAGVITLGDLGSAIARNCHGARFAEAEARLAAMLGQAPLGAAPTPARFALGTTLGLEQALAALSAPSGSPSPYYAGPLEGSAGPLLRAAIDRFQADHGLKADGVPGPLTRGALAKALGIAP